MFETKLWTRRRGNSLGRCITIPSTPTTRLLHGKTEYNWLSSTGSPEGGGGHWALYWAQPYRVWLSEHWICLRTFTVLTLQEFVQMNAWFLDPQAAQLFQGWGNSVFGQDSNSLCLGNFKIKRQSTLRVRWQVGKATLDHSLTYILTFPMYLTLET